MPKARPVPAALFLTGCDAAGTSRRTKAAFTDIASPRHRSLPGEPVHRRHGITPRG